MARSINALAIASKRSNPNTEATAQAIEDAIAFEAFHCDYIANLIESRARLLPQPSALHLTRRQDLLDLELDQPDLSLYEGPCHET